MVRTIRVSCPWFLLAMAACAPAALPLRDDGSSAASTRAAEAPPPEVPPLTVPAWSRPSPSAAPPAHEHAPAPKAHDHTPAPTPAAGAVYTCSMHPEVRQAQPGKCPECGMTLERIEAKP